MSEKIQKLKNMKFTVPVEVKNIRKRKAGLLMDYHFDVYVDGKTNVNLEDRTVYMASGKDNIKKYVIDLLRPKFS
jgi:hypothetical protein